MNHWTTVALVKRQWWEIQHLEVHLPTANMWTSDLGWIHLVSFRDKENHSGRFLSQKRKTFIWEVTNKKVLGAAVKSPLGTLYLHAEDCQATSSLFSIKLPANGHPRKQQVMAQALESGHSHERPKSCSKLLTLSLPSPNCCGHLENEPVHGRSVFFCVFLPFKHILKIKENSHSSRKIIFC